MKQIVFFGLGLSVIAQGTDYRQVAETLTHRIVAVTAFSSQTQVTRTARLSPHSGRRWYRVRGLPSTLDRGSLKVSLSSPRGKILQVVLEQSFEHVALNASVSRKLDDLKKNLAQLLDLSQQHANLSREVRFLSSLKFSSPFPKKEDANAFTAFRAEARSIGVAFQAVRNSIQNAQKLSEQQKDQIDELEEEIEFQLTELEGVTNRSEQKWVGNLYVQVESDKPWKGNLEVRYLMGNAKWTPLYDLRADLNRTKGTAAIKLVTAGLIEQHTGEDWNQVALKVSTRDPAPLWLPPMDRWVLGETRVAEEEMLEDMAFASEAESIGGGGRGAPAAEKPKRMARKKGAAPGAPFYGQAPSADSATRLSKDAAPPQSQAARQNWSPSKQSTVTELYPLRPLEELYPKYGQVKRSLSSLGTTQHREIPLRPTQKGSARPGRLFEMAGGRIIEIESPFKVDLASDEAPLKVPLASQLLRGELEYFAIPKKDPRVYLSATTLNSTKEPILSGKAQIFMNGDLVTKTTLPTVSEKGSFTVNLGIDENVETKRTVRKNSKTTGMISKTHETEVTVELEVANHNPFGIAIRVEDQHPLSPGENIEIKLKKTEPQANVNDSGVLSWKTRIPAKKNQKLTFTYLVTHPEDTIVSELN